MFIGGINGLRSLGGRMSRSSTKVFVSTVKLAASAAPPNIIIATVEIVAKNLAAFFIVRVSKTAKNGKSAFG